MNKGKQLKDIYDRLKIGDKITVHQAVEASYSNYAGNPEVFFTPEDVGTVIGVQIPCVTQSKAYKEEFVQVSFTKPVLTTRAGIPHTYSQWNAGIHYQNIKIIPQE
jgi:hypothetical protein